MFRSLIVRSRRVPIALKKARELSLIIVTTVITGSATVVSGWALDLNDGLVAYYPFNNGSTHDESGHNNNGLTPPDGPTPTTDRFGNPNCAFYFDGQTDTICVLNSPSLNFPLGSICVWVRFDEQTYYSPRPVSKGGQYELYFNYQSGNGGLIGANICAAPHNSGTIASSYTWMFLCLVKDENTVKIYRDAEVIYEKQVICTIDSTSTNLIIGRNPAVPFSQDLFKGKIDDIRIYNRPLSATEIGALHNAGELCTVTLTSPSQGAEIPKIGQLSWHSSCQAASFRVVLASDTTLANLLWAREVTDTSCSYDGPSLSADSFYFWSVQVYMDSLWLSYAPPHRFVLRGAGSILAAPLLESPVQDAFVAFPVTLAWSAVPGAFAYVGELSRAPSFNSVVASINSLGNSITVPELAGIGVGSSVYWRVYAVDSLGVAGNRSGVRQFQISASTSTPQEPTTHLPDESRQDSLTFTWSPEEGTSCYEVEFSTDPTFLAPSSSWQQEVCSGDTTVRIERPGATLFWRVRCCNSVGCSGWSAGPGTSGVPGEPCCSGGGNSDCLVVSMVGIQNDTVYVDKGQALSLNAVLAVKCQEHVWGGWYVDNSQISSFDIGTVNDTIVPLVSPLLPTATSGQYIVVLKAHAGSTSTGGRPVPVVIVDAVPGDPVSLSAEANPVSVVGNGLDSSVLTVSVVDVNHRKQYSATGLVVTVHLRGTGSLDKTSDTTVNGSVRFLYRAGMMPDTVHVDCASTGLTPDTVTLIVSGTPLLQLKQLFYSVMGTLDSMRLHKVSGEPLLYSQYVSTQLWSFYHARVDVASPVPGDTAVFRRLLLALDAVLQHYYHGNQHLYSLDDDATQTYSQEAAWDDAASDLQYLAAPVEAVIDQTYRLLPELPPTLQSITSANLTLLQSRLTDALNGVAMRLAAFPRTALVDAYQYVVAATMDRLASGHTPESVMVDPAIHGAADNLTLSYYTYNTQSVIDSIASWAYSNAYSGDYASAEQGADSLTALLKASGSVAQQVHDSLYLESVSGEYLSRLVAVHGKPIEKLFAMSMLANEVLEDAKYTDGLFVLGDLSGRLLVELPKATKVAFGNSGVPAPAAASYGVAAGSAGDYSIELAPFSGNFVEAQRQEVVEASLAYERQLIQAQSKIHSHSFIGLTDSLQLLSDKGQDLSQALSSGMAIVYSSSVSAMFQVSGYRDLLSGLQHQYQLSASDRGLTDFFGGYFDFDRTDEVLRSLCLSQIAATLESTQRLRLELDDILGSAYTLLGSPTLVVTEVVFSDSSFTISKPYTISAWVKNNGAGRSFGGYVKCSGGSRVSWLTADSLSISDLVAGDSTLIQFSVQLARLPLDSGKSGALTTLQFATGCSNGLGLAATSVVSYSFSCCVGTTGNVNMTGIVDLSDLSALVSYLTGGGYVLPCKEEANVNAAGIVDLSDLSALVSYLTGGGYVLPSCP